MAQAAAIRTADQKAFVRLLEKLRTRHGRFDRRQADEFKYLEAWEAAYRGDYPAASRQLEQLADDPATNADLRFRGLATLVNMLGIANRDEEAFAKLAEMLELMPLVKDPPTRQHGLQVAALLYNQASQFDLAVSYTDRLLGEQLPERTRCIAQQVKLEALRKSGRLKDPAAFDSAIEFCERIGEGLWASLIRIDAAQMLLELDRTREAIELLLQHYPTARNSAYPPLLSAYEAVLAEAYWRTNDFSKAQRFAGYAVVHSVPDEFTRPLAEATHVLYRVARHRGDLALALELHERFAVADKGYLNETSAKAMAFQTVQHQVAARKQEIDALSKRNQVLQLQQKVSTTEARTRGLYVLLLLVGLAFVAMWLWKTKRSQLHFMKLARRDGLTGIFNRAHFADAAESVLNYCRKGNREACAILIDLDNFKAVNDEYGHAAGDTVLKRTVQACQSHLRSIDIIGRLGGEEFGILLPNCEPERACALAEQFRLAIIEISDADTGVGFPVSASLGVTSSRWSGYNLRQLIIHADSAMYQAKRQGRNQVRLFDAALAPPVDPSAPQTFDRRRP